MLSRAATAASPAFLPASASIGLVRVTPTWSALSLPSSWGHHVLDVLGEHSGPVYEEPARMQLMWILPPGGAADWPDLTSARFVRYGPGDEILVPCPDGYHDGTRWLRSPLEPPLTTDPDQLRAAVEFVFGPLETADVLGPLVVCEDCRAPTRDGRITEEFIGASGPLFQSYACPRCWEIAAAGGRSRHLRVVRREPP